MHLRLFITFIISIVLMQRTFAQEQINFNLFDQSYVFYNPAKIISNPTEIIFINRNNTPNNLNSNFLNSFLGVSQKFNKVRGVFLLNYAFDQYSFFTQNIISFGYSYPLKLGKNKSHILSFGARFNGILNSIQYDRLGYTHFKIDRQTQFRADVDLGIYYHWKNFELGVSAKHLTSPSLKYEGITYIQNVLTTNLLASYKARIKKTWFIKPLLHIVRTRTWSFKPSVSFGLNDIFEAGINFDFPSFHLAYNAGFYINKMIGIFGSFNHSLVARTKNFEILVRIDVNKNNRSKKRKRTKKVKTLK